MKRLLKDIKQRLEAFGVKLLVWGIKIFGYPFISCVAALGRKCALTILPRVHKGSLKSLYNIQQTFPHKSLKEVEQIYVNSCDNLIRTMGEYHLLERFERNGSLHNIRIEGLEHLLSLRDDGKPGFLATGHFGHWQMITLVARAHGLPVHQLYRPANNPYVDAIERKAQEAATAGVLTKSKEGAKALVGLMNTNQHIMMLLDQRFGQGPRIPFLGRPATTATAIARLALKHDAVIVPACGRRVGRDPQFVVTFYPPIECKNTNNIDSDSIAIMTQINSRISEWIYAYPDQWMWMHDRWK